ncbi:MAG: hypothetical protein AAF702_11825 [Chloroflexota bacterium]
MVTRRYSNEFEDLNSALAFGEEIDFIAKQDGATILTGRNKDIPKSVLGAIFVHNTERYDHTGQYHVVEKDAHRDVYRVKYADANLRDFSVADQLEAKQFVTNYLSQKYDEINPNPGISRI